MTGVERTSREVDERSSELKPLRQYAKAQRLFIEGNQEESLAELSRAIGSSKPLPRLAGYLPKAFDPDSILSDMVLKLTLVETRRRNKP